MYSVKNIAETILCFQSMTHKKLQKLFYYTYVWYYIVFDSKLCDTNFEAWVHGPVSPELYHQYKSYGWSRIENEKGTVLSDSKYEFIKTIFSIYGDMNAEELEELTHKETPWLSARKGLNKYEYSDNVIMDFDLKNYYPKAYEKIYNYLKDKFN